MIKSIFVRNVLVCVCCGVWAATIDDDSLGDTRARQIENSDSDIKNHGQVKYVKLYNFRPGSTIA